MLLALALCATLAVVTATDLARREIPNRVLAAATATALAIAAATAPATLPGRSLAAALGGGALLPVALARPEGLGMGDVKLVAVIGLYLGPALAVAVPVAFALGAVVGAVLVVRDGLAARHRALPFAPFLAAGGVVGVAAGNPIIHWYAARMFEP